MLRALILVVCLMGCSAPQERTTAAALVLAKCGACHSRPAADDREGWARVRAWHAGELGLSDADMAGIQVYFAPAPAVR